MFKSRQISLLLRNKRFLLLLFVLIFVAAFFWSQSRYPELGHKAMMGGETQLEAIGFDVLLPMPKKPSLAREIYVNSVNWMYTNRKGMTFGVIFGAILMTMMPFLNGLQFRSRIANSALGIAIGTPLGVCVNCSTPIAHGMYEKGARPETMLATMISSPTLNIVVLTMLFALFPPWIAIMKIGATLIFILVWIPLLTRWLKPLSNAEIELPEPDRFSKKFEEVLADPSCGTSDENCDQPAIKESWLKASRWAAINFGRNLWNLTKMMVPLMILAGVLGAALVTLLPLESLAGQLPEGRLFSWLSMAILAVIGLFIPSPMTFDVIISAILLSAGAPIKYVAILLFTLGIFSVYPFMTLWRKMSYKVPVGMASVLVLMGVASGVIANRYAIWDVAQQQKRIFEPFAKSANPPELPYVDRAGQGSPADELLPRLEKTALRDESEGRVKGLDINRISFNLPNPIKPKGKTMMHRYFQSEFGITETENYSILKMDNRYSSSSRGLASGDVNRDGWPDLVISSDAGLALYLNKQGKEFEQQRLEIPRLNKLMIPSAALVDINNDGWLDLWISSLRDGNFIIYSAGGQFFSKNMTAIDNHAKAVLTNAAAFGDLDRDGKLDVVLGNVSATAKSKDVNPFNSAKNVWLRQTPEGFAMELLPGLNGESLTTLLSDIDQNGSLDLLIGNDLSPPDLIYLGDGKGGLKLVKRSDGLIPVTTDFTMSISSADLDNDLKPEIFFGSVSPPNFRQKGAFSSPETPTENCAELTSGESRRRCEEFYSFAYITGQASKRDRVWECQKLTKRAEREACVAYSLMQYAAAHTRDEKLCNLYPPGWEYFAFVCRSHFAPKTPISEKELDQAIPQTQLKQNVLLKQNKEGVFEDRAKEFGVNESAWSWNSKFADLDNDGWQDLFVVNGSIFRKRRASNFFYRNLEGKGFEEITEKSGLTSFLKTPAYTYFDIDNDGDLDIIVAPIVGPISVYVNQTARRESIAFELHDKIGNYYGIGSKIVINYGDGKHQMRELQASGGYLSYDAPIAYFGLGDQRTIKSVEIEWSTGEKSVIDREFKSGARYIITRSE